MSDGLCASMNQLEVSSCSNNVLSQLGGNRVDDVMSKCDIEERRPPLIDADLHGTEDLTLIAKTIGRCDEVEDTLQGGVQEGDRGSPRLESAAAPPASGTGGLQQQQELDDDAAWSEQIEAAARLALRPTAGGGEEEEEAEDDLTAGLVADVNRLLLMKLRAAGLEHILTGPDTCSTSGGSGEPSPRKILASSFIRKFSSLYRCEVMRCFLQDCLFVL